MRNKHYPWIVVALLWGVALLNYMDRQMLATMRPAMQTDIPELQSGVSFGYLMGIFLWVYGFMSPVAGVIADRVNRKWLITASLLIWSAVTFAMGFAANFRELYWLRAIMGISEALYIPAGLSLIADYHPNRTRSLAIGIHMTGLYLGQAIGGFGAGVAASVSWQTAFQLFGGIGIAYSLVLTIFLREKRTESANPETPTDAGPGRTPTTPAASPTDWLRVLVILLVFAIASLPGWSTKNWLPTMFAQHLHLPMTQAGPLSTITLAAASFAGVLLGGWLSDRWVQRTIRGRVYTSAIGLAAMIPSLLLLGFSHQLAFVLAAAILFGAGYGIFDANNMPILCQFVSPRHRATAYGFINMTGVFSGALITQLLGHSSDTGQWGLVFGLLSFGIAIALATQLYFLRPQKN